MIEYDVVDVSKRRNLKAAGYRIIRRYENNGWYVPVNSSVAGHWAGRREIARKYYLALPFRMLRNLSRRVRKPVRDQSRAGLSGLPVVSSLAPARSASRSDKKWPRNSRARSRIQPSRR